MAPKRNQGGPAKGFVSALEVLRETEGAGEPDGTAGVKDAKRDAKAMKEGACGKEGASGTPGAKRQETRIEDGKEAGKLPEGAGGGGLRGGSHDVAAAARFGGGVMSGDQYVGGAWGRVPLCLSHDVCLRLFNQN